MNTKKLETYVNLLGTPVLTAAAGLVLLVNPAGATALLTRAIGWLLAIGAAIRLIGLASSNQLRWGRSAFFTGAILGLGVILLAKPMILGTFIGRFIGLLLVIEGVRNLKDGVDLRDILSIAAGAVLWIMPQTLTNAVLSIVGIVLLVLGVINILGRLRKAKYLNQGSTPGIIDADM